MKCLGITLPQTLHLRVRVRVRVSVSVRVRVRLRSGDHVAPDPSTSIRDVMRSSSVRFMVWR